MLKQVQHDGRVMCGGFVKNVNKTHVLSNFEAIFILILFLYK